MYLKNIMERIDIHAYVSRYAAYTEDVVSFANTHGIILPSISTMGGQALALMSEPDVRGKKYITPQDTETFFTQLGYSSRDAIQRFNKVIGFRRFKQRGVYCLLYPYEYDRVEVEKRKGAAIHGDRNSRIDAIKEFWKENIVDVPNQDWQVGHLDPTIADASEDNLAYQPPIQGKYRNMFKWDPYFMRMWPTAQHVIRNWTKYYTDSEQRVLYDNLKAKFEPPPPLLSHDAV